MGGRRFVTVQSNALNCSTRDKNASELQLQHTVWCRVHFWSVLTEKVELYVRCAAALASLKLRYLELCFLTGRSAMSELGQPLDRVIPYSLYNLSSGSDSITSELS